MKKTTFVTTLTLTLALLASSAEASPHKRKNGVDTSTIAAPAGQAVFSAKAQGTLNNAVRARFTGRHEEGIQLLNSLEIAPPFASADFLKGILYFHQKKYEAALTALGKAEKNAGPLADYVRLYLGRTLMALNRPQEALDQLVGIPRTGRLVERDMLKVRLKAHEALKQAGQAAATKSALQKTASEAIAQALTPSAQDIYRKLSQQKNVPREEMANAAFKARQYGEAARLFEETWQHSSQKGQGKGVEILSLWATSLGRAGLHAKAIEVSQKLMTLFPRTTEAWKAEEKIAYLYFDAAQFEKSRTAYRALLAKKKDVQENRWRLFWCDYLTGNFSQALATLDAMGGETDTGRYWRARVLEKLGRAAPARAIYAGLARGRAGNYYAWLSGQRLKGSLHAKTIVTLTGGEPNRGRFETLVFPANDPVAAALALASIGEYRYAFDESIRPGPGGPRSAQIWSLTSNYHQAYLNGISHPRAYEDLVTMAANSQGLDPALIWAIMRQESTFKPFVVSRSAAFGLMQIIPPTAHEIARTLGEEPFSIENLLDPPVSIRFGSSYLRTLLNHFNGRLPQAIAAYNAGPDAVDRWEKKGNLEADEFIELIPYEQTNDYVKKVLVNYWKYRAAH